jgi:HPt (histidine-containing phosphotransfer) domain-containing protein
LIAVFAEEARSRLAATEDLRAIGDEAHGLTSAAGTFGAAALLAADALQVAGETRIALALRDSLPVLVERSLAAYPVRLSDGD